MSKADDYRFMLMRNDKFISLRHYTQGDAEARAREIVDEELDSRRVPVHQIPPIFVMRLVARVEVEMGPTVKVEYGRLIHTIEDVRDALRMCPRQIGLDILRKQGARSVSQLDQDMYGTVIQACERRDRQRT